MFYRLGIRALKSIIWLLPLLVAAGADAQSLNLDLGEGGSSTARIIQMVVLLTVLSLAPSLLIMVTSFVRIVVVLSILRTALGLQQTPPNMVLISLALFLTLFIMTPVFEKSYEQGVVPLINEELTEKEAFPKIIKPFHGFMMDHVSEKDLRLFSDMAKEKAEKEDEVSLRVLIPAFMISELRRAFEIGFLIYLPFLIIDMLVASVLMSMGMMMLPPVLISLPFKLIFFVIVDGWYAICGSLVKSFGAG